MRDSGLAKNLTNWTVYYRLPIIPGLSLLYNVGSTTGISYCPEALFLIIVVIRHLLTIICSREEADISVDYI